MKKAFRFLLVLLVSFILVGCAKEKAPEISTKVVPIYEGMSIQNKVTKPRHYRDNDDYVDLIPDLGEDSKVSYFTKPEEMVNIEIHLHNPDQFEILSLTLNDRKYQSFEFKEGSTGEMLILGIEAPSNPGEYTYTIDKIKYIDGDDIEDVDMSNGNKTIDFGVTYLNLPELKVFDEEITTNSFKASLNIIDNNSILEKAKGLKGYLFDMNHKLIQKTEINDSINFSNLENGFSYHYALAISFDALDGKGSKTHILYESDFDTLSNIGFKKVSIYETGFEYEIYQVNSKVELSNILLYDGEAFTDITDVKKVDGLLTNHEYKIVINYKLDNESLKTVKIIKTASLEKPEISAFSVEASKNEISFDYSIADANKVINKSYARLYLNDVLKQEINLEKKNIKGLLSDTVYDLELVLEYDLNDGRNTQTVVLRKSVKTLPLEKPKVGISYTLKENIFKGLVSVIDNDKTYKFDHYELCNSDGDLINSLLNIEEINDLKRNTNYQLKLVYYYNLNDGKGDVKAEYTLNFTTTKQIPELKIEEYYIKNNAFGLDIYETDPNVIGEISGIRLFDEKDNFLKAIPVSNTIEFTSLLANTKYKVKIYYAYDLDDGNGSQEIIYNHEITTAKNMPSLDFNLDATQKTIDATLNINDKDKALEITNVLLSLNGKEISSGKELSFSNLLSDNVYKVKIEYKYDLHDLTGEHTKSLEKEVKTLPLVAPEVKLSLANADYRSLSFKYELADSDNTFKFSKAILSLNGNEVKALALDSLVANDLYTNNNYELAFYYQYDLNDGNGIHNEVIKFKASTLKYENVNLSYDKLMATEDSISFDYLIADESKSLKITKIELYDNENKLVEALSDLTVREFKNLNKGSFYKIITTYTYDLLDGKGVITDQSTQEYGTIGSKLFIEEIRVLNNEAILVGDKVHINVRLTNPNNLYVTGLYFNDYRFDITQHDIENNFVNATFVPDFDGGLYDIVLTGYSYLVKNGDKEIELTENLFESYKAQVAVLGYLDVLDYKSSNEYPYSIAGTKDLILEYDATKGYKIEGINTDNCMVGKENIEEIAPGKVKFSISQSGKFANINQISYSLYGHTTNINLRIDSNVFVLTSAEITHVSKPTDFRDAKSLNGIFVVDNDLDFKDYTGSYGFNFSGVLIGNKHKFKNVSIVTKQGKNTENVAFFGMFEGYAGDIDFVNPYIVTDLSNVNRTAVFASNLYGTIENINCYNTYVKSKSTTATAAVVAHAWNGSSITGSNVTGEIGGLNLTGSIVGIMQGFKLKDCSFKGSLTGQNEVGGLVGVMQGNTKFENLQNFADVTGTQCVGGIVGKIENGNNHIEKAYNAGNIYASSTQAGGIVGEAASYEENNFISNVLNIGQVDGYEYIGGILGYSNIQFIEISNAINLGELKHTPNSAPSPRMGLICSAFNSGQGLIKNSYSKGTGNINTDHNENLLSNVYNDNKDGSHYVLPNKLNSKEFWLELQFDEAVWSLDSLDASKGIYPSLKFVK